MPDSADLPAATLRPPPSPEAAISPVGPAPDVVGRIEGHGIDVIPDDERHGRARDLFGFWMGSNIVFTFILFGGILIQLGLSLPMALALALVGNCAWVLVGVLSVPGPRSGTASMVVSRAQYGIRGNRLSCLLSWVVNVGWEGVNFSIAALAAYSLLGNFGGDPNLAAKAVVLGVLVFASFILGLYGHATILWFQTWVAWILGIAAVLLLVFLLPQVKFDYAPQDKLGGSALTVAVLIGLSVVLSGPLSYPFGADYSRYLPAQASPKQVIWYTALGGYVPTLFLTVVGILAATVVDASDFTNTIAAVLPGWFYPVFLLIVIVGAVCNGAISVYSSGLALQALGVPLRRSLTVYIDAFFGSALAIFGVLIASNFLTVLQNFLLWSIYWYAPFFGVFLVELARTRGWYKGHELFEVGGAYWFSDGYRWRGIAALLLGMAFSALTSNTPYFQGFISAHWLDGGDLSAVGGLVVGAVTYGLLCAMPKRRPALQATV